MRPATTLRVMQGCTLIATVQAVNFDGSLPTNYLMSDVLTGKVWLTAGGTPLFTFTPTWTDNTTGKIGVELSQVQTATLSSANTYNVQTFVTRSGKIYGGTWTSLEIEDTAL